MEPRAARRVCRWIHLGCLSVSSNRTPAVLVLIAVVFAAGHIPSYGSDGSPDQLVTLSPIPAQQTDELITITFTASASGNGTLTFSLTNPPDGASINSTTGIFVWTPAEDQNGTHQVTVTVSDARGGTDSQAVMITVNETNSPPTLETVWDILTFELLPLDFVVPAADPDDPPDTLTFSAVGLPDGASINPSSGTFSWTPAEDQDGLHRFNLTVSDGRGGSDSQTVSVGVLEVNQPPAFDAAPNRIASDLSLLSLNLTATDPDLPANTLTYSLVDPPEGASIDPRTGHFSWTPVVTDGRIDPIAVLVDDGAGGSDFLAIEIEAASGISGSSSSGGADLRSVGSNRPPDMQSISPFYKHITECDTLSFTVRATDADGDTVSLELGDKPTGVDNDPSISDTTSYVFLGTTNARATVSWETTHRDAGSNVGEHPFQVIATDDHGATDWARTWVLVWVALPTFSAPTGTQTATAGEELTVQVTASNEACDDDTIRYSMYIPRNSANGQVGMDAELRHYIDQYIPPCSSCVNPTTGVFTWTPTQVGLYHVVVTATDGHGRSGNKVFHVMVDDPSPTITVRGSNPVTIAHGSTYSDRGATCRDIPDGTLPVRSSGTVDTTTPGYYTITYRCTDSAGQGATATRTVIVDDPSPTITVRGSNPVTIAHGSTYSDRGATCRDIPDGTLPVRSSGTVDTTTPGYYTITYRCTDSAGQGATATRTVIVDDPSPTITVRGSNPVTIAHGSTYSDRGATCRDIPDGTLPVRSSGTVDTTTPGYYTITYRCTDSAGQGATATRTVIVDQPNPTADAGEHQLVPPLTTVTLDGTKSEGLPGMELMYRWTTSNETITLVNPTTAQPTFNSQDTIGFLTFELTVTSGGRSAIDTVDVIVNTPPQMTITPSDVELVKYVGLFLEGELRRPILELMGTDADNERLAVVVDDPPDERFAALANCSTLDQLPVTLYQKEHDVVMDFTELIEQKFTNYVCLIALAETINASGDLFRSTFSLNVTDGGWYVDNHVTYTIEEPFVVEIVELAGDAIEGLFGGDGRELLNRIGKFIRNAGIASNVGMIADLAYVEWWRCYHNHGANELLCRGIEEVITEYGEETAQQSSAETGEETAQQSSAETGEGVWSMIGQTSANGTVASPHVLLFMDKTSSSAAGRTPDGNSTEGTPRTARTPDGNLTESVTITMYDSDVEPGRTYVYAVRLTVNGIVSDFIPMGNVTMSADTMAPIIVLLGQTNMTVPLGSTYMEPGYYAVDDYDGYLTANVTVTGVVDANTVGTYKLYYDVRDGSGNNATRQIRTVSVVPEFVTTWRTTSANGTITIPVGGATGAYTVDWGDNSTSMDVTGNQTHEYEAPGEHTIRISGDFARIHLGGDPANAAKLVSIDQWGGTQWTTMSEAFAGATNMAYRATDAPDLSSVTDMSGMFRNATSFNADISSWDVSRVIDMGSMFEGAASFNQDISSWDVSRVIDMGSMFEGAASFNQDISSWDVSRVIDMGSMFEGAASFNQDISSWDVSRVTDMSGMFRNAASFNQDISSWDVSRVIDMGSMFEGAASFNQDISSWDVSRITDMSGMFNGAASFDWNLGPWYIVSDDTSIRYLDAPGTVVEISARNAFLDGRNPTYGIGTGGDSALFGMANGTILVMETAPGRPIQNPYIVNVTASGVLGGDGPHHRVIPVEVELPPNVSPVVDAGPDLTVFEGGTTFLDGTASDPDPEDSLAVLWTQSPARPAIYLDDATLPATPLSAPLVSGNATITLTLTATDSRNGTTTDTATIRIVDTPLPPGAFVTTWRTTQPNEPVTIPASRGTGAYHIDWGDGSVSTGVTDSQTHRYETPGEHTVAIAGDFARMNMAGNAANAAKLVSIDQWGDIRWTSMRSAFYGAANMVYRATDIPDLSSVDTMAHMFRNAASFNGDISGWDVSAVSSMFSAFDGATSFNQNLGRWYVTLDETAIPHGDPSRTVGTISAQSSYLDGQNPAYGIGTGADSGLFEIADGSLLRLREVPDYYDRSSYAVNVTADGSRLFGEDNHILLKVTVAAPINNPPTADAGPDRTVRPGTAVTLNGTGSSDHDVLDRLSYSWNQTAGEPVSLSNRTSPTPAFDAPGGTSVLAFELSVTDRGGLSDTDAVSINVTSDAPANRPPVVNAGPDHIVNEGEPVALAGTASDPEGEQLTHLWTHDSSLDLDMEGADTASVSFTAPQVSSNTTITLTLTAADRHNQTAADSAAVTILDVPEEPPAQPIRNSTAVLEPPDPRGPRDIGRITLTSSSPGTIHASWEEPAEDPANYRISWARVGEPFKTWTDQTGNAFPTEPAHTITGLEEGVEYKVMVLASYSGTSGGWSGELTIAVAESSPNRPPTVSAGPDRTVNEGDPVALSGTATDPDGDDLTYLWTHDSTLAITLENATALSTTFTAPEVGSNTTVTLTLTATDQHNQTAADTMTLTVTDVPAAPANRPPSVDAGPDLNVAEGQPVALSGTATDPDGDQLTYLWTHDSTLAITLENATALSTTFTAPEVGSNTTVTFTLTANDGAATASDSVAVTITDTPAEPPLDPREIGEITLGSTQPGTVRASWNPTIEEARDYRISWARAGEPFPSWTDSSGNAYPTDPSHTITGLDEGEEYKVKARARYADDTSGPWSGEFTIMVASAANRPPVANAGPDRAVASGATVELDGSGSNDPDGDALSYLWSQTSGQTAALSNATAPSPTFTAPAGPAALVFRLNVTDTGSLSSTDTVTVNVAAPANRPPTVDAGDGQSVQEGNTATLTGTASDPDGDPLTYRWTHDSALTITLENATALSTTFTAPGVDSDTAITFTLTAEDGRGASSSDTVSVTILAGSPPDPPQNLQATSTNTTVTLTWDDPGDATITGYKILSRAPVTQTQLSTLVNNTASAAATYTVTDLEPGTAYVFRVVAINEHGESGRSDFVRISTLP